ncbi:MAG: DEAD/DEAH box helicase [Microbacterium sp.]
MKTTTIFGGVNQNRQVAALGDGVDIVVACPGRLEDLMKQGFVKLDAVGVIDEADHMADLGFLRIGDPHPRGDADSDSQQMLFSATLDNGVDKLVNRFLENEVLHSVDEAACRRDDAPRLPRRRRRREEELVRTLASGHRILFMRTSTTQRSSPSS